MDHIEKTIETFDARIAEIAAKAEREILELKKAVNQICVVAGKDPKYEIDENAASITTIAAKQTTMFKSDEFYNKPFATAVRQVLSALRNVNQAPAKVDAIYDLLLQGGFDFASKNRETAIQGLTVSIGKNSDVFVKLPNGLIGLKEWYGLPARARPRGASKETNGNGDDEQQTPSAPSQGDAETGGTT
jgi:hypothetical protein